MRWAVAFALSLASAAAAVAAPLCGDTESCLAAIERAQKTTQSLSARFEQTKHLSLMTEPIVGRGRFALRHVACPPNAEKERCPDGKTPEILWQSEDPPLRLVIRADGVELPPEVAREAGEGSKALTSALQQVGSLLSGSVAGVARIGEVEAQPSPAGISVHLVPRQAAVRELFSAVDLEFVAPHLVLQSIRISESLGDRLEITFSEIHRNDEIAEAAFRP